MLGEKGKGAIHLPEQAILILEKKKESRPTNEKGGNKGAVKSGSARRKQNRKPLPTKCRLGKRGDRRRRIGAAAHLRGSSREGLGFPPALLEEREVGFAVSGETTAEER